MKRTNTDIIKITTQIRPKIFEAYCKVNYDQKIVNVEGYVDGVSEEVLQEMIDDEWWFMFYDRRFFLREFKEDEDSHIIMKFEGLKISDILDIEEK